MPEKRVSLIGDCIQDVIVSDSGSQPIVWEKANYLSETEDVPERKAIWKRGGVWYTHHILRILLGEGADEMICTGEALADEAHKKRNLARFEWDSGEFPRMIWQAAKRPRKIDQKDDKKCWRAVDRVASSILPDLPTENQKLKEFKESLFPGLKGNGEDRLQGEGGDIDETIQVVVDYNRRLRGVDPGEGYWEERLKKPAVIMIGNDMPPTPGSPAIKQSPLWEAFYGDGTEAFRNRHVIVISINVLRRMGAVISRRKSWDRTVDDFINEMNRMPEFEKFFAGRRLIVRIGLSAALYVDWTTKDSDPKVKFIYAPEAPGVVFRDPSRQGTNFATRAIYTACVTSELVELGNPVEAEDKKFSAALLSGIRKSIYFSQESFPYGFGKTWEEVRRFPYIFTAGDNENYYESVYRKICDESKKNPEERLESRYQMVSVPCGSDVNSWNLWAANLRGNLDEPKTAKGDNWHRAEFDPGLPFAALERMRRLRCALQVAKFGTKNVINLRGSRDEGDKSEVARLLKMEWYLSRGAVFPDQMNRDEFEATSSEILSENSPQWSTFNDGSKNFKDSIADHLEMTPFNGPTVRYGKYLALGQSDIENCNNIQELLRQHLLAKSGSPISFAVFGSPGNGKSFTVEEIAHHLDARLIERLTFNLSSFNSPDHLASAFVKVAELAAAGKVPLVFFDEFDSPRAGRPLGWLKYFLAPMQDGMYLHRDGVLKLGNSIFVFAGGIFESFSEFRNRANPAFAEEDWDPKDAKVPDFVSRLRGHLDIPGIDRIPSGKAGLERSWQNPSDHYTPYLRRAILINGMLRKHDLIRESNRKCAAIGSNDEKSNEEESEPDPEFDDLGRCWKRELDAEEPGEELEVIETARIADDLLRAMITVSEYRHGARSVSSVINAIMPLGQKLEKAGMPVINQLNMHTHGAEFYCRAVFPHLVWIEDRLGLAPQHNEFKTDEATAGFWNKYFTEPDNWVELDWNEEAVVQHLDLERRDFEGKDYVSRKLFQWKANPSKSAKLKAAANHTKISTWEDNREEIVQEMRANCRPISTALLDLLKKVITTRYTLREAIASGRLTEVDLENSAKDIERKLKVEVDQIFATDDGWLLMILCNGTAMFPLALNWSDSKIKVGINPYSRVERNRREIREVLIHLLDLMVDVALNDQRYEEYVIQ